MPDKVETILSVRNFSAGFMTGSGLLTAVEDVSFDLRAGSTLGIVGESGCGKSVTALSVMKLLPVPQGRYLSGEILFKGSNLLDLSPAEMCGIRGDSISMIFQEPMTALNPVKKIGRQVAEIFELHRKGMSEDEISDETETLLHRVGISDPRERMNSYPHQLSGGMRQRVMIAMALSCKPDILIADEPTTALDVTIQAQILELIKELQAEYGMSVIFITHDLGVIAQLCNEVIVMYAGRIAERASAVDLFSRPLHPYTAGLLDSIPRFENTRKSRLNSIEGIVPHISEYPAGCRFQNRCNRAFEPCSKISPVPLLMDNSHEVSCYIYGGYDGTDS